MFYKKIVGRGLCVEGQEVLDLGTGTGVLPRNMYRYGAHWTGTDISPEQIEAAKRLAEAGKMEIDFMAIPAEQIDFPKESFNVITACQCFWYSDHEKDEKTWRLSDRVKLPLKGLHPVHILSSKAMCV